ncbi:unnamed protein product [Rhizoctonia solani]|uniref:NmrA-like domain-containing protein n=1 Tax=Rhizoctonia solani TaxID=456999 RepID=A0A8H3H5S0_9AGAM|nr:unnamed protein product [Rhizoctonia solani]
MKASVECGIKLFFPSEFALESTSDAESNASNTKEGIVKIAESLELPHARILDGLFPHWYITNIFSNFIPPRTGL